MFKDVPVGKKGSGVRSVKKKSLLKFVRSCLTKYVSALEYRYIGPRFSVCLVGWRAASSRTTSLSLCP